MYKIAIVIPMYNVEKYISEAIESVIKQTIGFKNIQLLLIDDFSEDNTQDICKIYAKKYENIIYKRVNEKGGGPGGIRNLGTKLVDSKYMMYVDGDDILEPSACKVLYEAMESKKADCVISNYRNMNENGEKWKKPMFDIHQYDAFHVNIEDYKKSYFILESAVWNKMYRTAFIKEKKLQFLEGVMAEDAYFCLQSYIEADQIYYIPDVTYNYRIRNKGQASISRQVSIPFFDKYNRGYKAIYSMLKKYPFKNLQNFFFTKAIMFMTYKIIDSSQTMLPEELEEVFEQMQWFFSLPDKEGVIITQEYIKSILHKITNYEYKQAIELCYFFAEIRKDLPDEINQRLSIQDAKKYIEFYEKGGKVY